MARIEKMTQKQYAMLEELFMGQFEDKRKNPRMKKSETLFELGRQARDGAIVELGTYHGNGAIALAWGTRKGFKCPVHTVDPYTPNHGWVGEPYVPEDEEIFTQNIKRANATVTLHKELSLVLARTWNEPIALLYWDEGAPNTQAAREIMLNDFMVWSAHIVIGGVFAVHEPGTYGFGGDEVIAIALSTGMWEPAVQWGGYIWSIQKKG